MSSSDVAKLRRRNPSCMKPTPDAVTTLAACTRYAATSSELARTSPSGVFLPRQAVTSQNE